MTREKLFEMIEYTDDRFLSRSEKNTVAIPVKEQKKEFPFKAWKIQYVAAAIAIVLLTSVTAVAAVTMIRRQAELKEQLGISGKNVPEYVEFDVSVTDVTTQPRTTGEEINVTVLSGIREEQFQKWYFTISPLTREEAETLTWYVGSDEFGGGYGEATIVDWTGVHSAENPRYDVGVAYDESSQSLMLETSVSMREDSSRRLDPTRVEAVEMQIIGAIDLWDAEGVHAGIDEKYHLTAMFTPTVTDVNTRTVVFGNSVHFTNPNTGAQGTITDVEIYASGSIHMHYTISEEADTMDRYFNQSASMPNAEYLDLQDNVFIPWSNAADEVMSGMTINLKDGSSTGGSVSVGLTYKDGVLEAKGSAGRMIALDEIESVTIAGQTFEVE